MMPKKSGLHNLPQNITEHVIGEYLTEKDKLALALSSKTTQGLFQPHRLQIMANKLLLQVMHGEQDKAKKILKRHVWTPPWLSRVELTFKQNKG